MTERDTSLAFYRLSAIALSILVGALIPLPILALMPPAIAGILPLFGAVLGFVIGKRHGHHRFFLYFVALAALVLLTLLLGHSAAPE